jgi:hypothetical protein
MARKKSKKSAKKKPVLWQWVIVAAAAFLLYQGLEYWLSPDRKASTHRTVAVKGKNEKRAAPVTPPAATKPRPTPSPTPAPQATAAPVPKWDFKNAARFLPPEAYPDNYSAVPLPAAPSGLLAYAKTIPGKKPGPQGLTNTQPGLRSLWWDGKHYQTKDLDFEALKPTLSGLRLVGPPQLERKAWIENGGSVYPVKLFLNDETRLVSGFVVIDAEGPRWAPLQGEGGKTGPAAFLQGTTAAVTRKVSKLEREGKRYVVVEKGSLDLVKPEAGYQWKVEAYAWNGKAFVLDAEVSAKLTQEKKAEL